MRRADKKDRAGMNEYLKSLVGGLLESSSFVASLRELKQAQGRSRLFGDRIRPLTAGEIDALKSRGNSSPNWSRVLAAEGFTPAFIANSNFLGNCVLGVLGGEEVLV
jgi:hypothetical protein